MRPIHELVPITQREKKVHDLITCDECGKSRTKVWFNEEAIQNWHSCDPLNVVKVLCKQCRGERCVREEAMNIFCFGECQQKLPEFHFDEESLVRWMATDITEAKR